MEIDIREFQRKLLDLYRADPAGTSSIAYWKTRDLCEDARAYLIPEYDCCYLIRHRHLLVYHAPDNQNHIPLEELAALDCISMKASVFDTIRDRLSGFVAAYGECLLYDRAYRPTHAFDDVYLARDFDFHDGEHYRLAAALIDENEGGGFFTAENVRKMSRFSAFVPHLWFFVEEKATGEPVGICIAAYSPEVRETDLDWVFIRPDRHGRGAGRFMMEEIVRRSLGSSDFIRVGGTVAFYKRCGFYTAETHVWASKPGFAFYAPKIQPNVTP